MSRESAATAAENSVIFRERIVATEYNSIMSRESAAAAAENSVISGESIAAENSVILYLEKVLKVQQKFCYI
jgi:hypothetical protein